MALVTLAQVQVIPGMSRISSDFLTALIPQADRAVKEFCKRDLEETDYDNEYHSGRGQQDIILRQGPVEADTVAVWCDPGGYWGQSPTAFASTTQLTQGTQWALILDDSQGDYSYCGLLRKIGGTGAGWIGAYPETYGGGKLSASRVPCWPRGDGNIKVAYTAGYATIPADLVYATAMLVAFMVRNMPSGSALNNESLGSYSYSVASIALGGNPELGTVIQTLKRYREISWGND